MSCATIGEVDRQVVNKFVHLGSVVCTRVRLEFVIANCSESNQFFGRKIRTHLELILLGIVQIESVLEFIEAICFRSGQR